MLLPSCSCFSIPVPRLARCLLAITQIGICCNGGSQACTVRGVEYGGASAGHYQLKLPRSHLNPAIMWTGQDRAGSGQAPSIPQGSVSQSVSQCGQIF